MVPFSLSNPEPGMYQYMLFIFLGKINCMVVFCKKQVVYSLNLFPVTHSATVLGLSLNIVPTSSGICEIFVLFLISIKSSVYAVILPQVTPSHNEF